MTATIINGDLYLDLDTGEKFSVFDGAGELTLCITEDGDALLAGRSVTQIPLEQVGPGFTR